MSDPLEIPENHDSEATPLDDVEIAVVERAGAAAAAHGAEAARRRRDADDERYAVEETAAEQMQLAGAMGL